jgi:DNA-binding CsgD family transcriptional regulator
LLGYEAEAGYTALSSDRRRRLTARVTEILSCLARGKSNEESRCSFRLAAHDSQHLDNPYRKLGVHTRAAAVAWLVAAQN